jgi:hypothetical protein
MWYPTWRQIRADSGQPPEWPGYGVRVAPRKARNLARCRAVSGRTATSARTTSAMTTASGDTLCVNGAS